jgi:SAM-dependent methyltransferase
MHVSPGNPLATIVGDLQDAPQIPEDQFDCVVFTQTLHLIYDMPAAMRTLHRILRPGGVLLMTVPGISQIDEDEWGGTWYWSLTALSARRLTCDAFPGGEIEVEAHGNVLAATAFLHGLATSEVADTELDHRDPHYPVVITVRAVKAGGSGGVR